MVESRAESTGPADFSLAQPIMWKDWELFPSIIATHPELKKKKKNKKKKYVLLALSEIAWSAGAALLTSLQISHKDKEIEGEAEEAGKRITGACWLKENWKYKTNVHPLYVATF